MAKTPHEHGPGEQAYAVTCQCGEVRRGKRQQRSQLITCGRCGSRLFVLPASPWPTTEAELVRLSSLRIAAVPAPGQSSARARRSPWWWPALAALTALLVVAAGIAWLMRGHRPHRQEAVAERVRDQLRIARAALDVNDIPAATAALNAARAAKLSGATREAIELATLSRQMRVLVDLLEPSLEELFVESRSIATDVWNKQFGERHAGRALVFDARVMQLDKSTQGIQLDYRLEAAGTRARISLSDLADADTVFGSRIGRRTLFAVRLASFRLEADAEHSQGLVVVRFQPNSLLLITDHQVASCLGFTLDGELKSLLDQQSVAFRSVEPPLKPGDSAGDVRRLYGAPDRIARQVLARRVIEQWVYSGAREMALNLERRGKSALVIARHGPSLPK
jgi:hypothetical protein